MYFILKSPDNTNENNMILPFTIKDANLTEYINRELEPKEKEKNEFGEVFTPLHLIHEMLDKLDAHYTQEKKKSIFSEKSYTWFDPACGIGNFPIVVYQRLMEGLKSEIPKEENRRKHIIENMLFMSELSARNVAICRKIFCEDVYQVNIHKGNTLSLDVNQKWNIQSFDIIVGNPPYNAGGIRSKKEKNISTVSTVWPKFITYSLDILKQNGYLAFINPLSWLRKSYSVHSTLLEKHIVWLKLWDNNHSKTIINARIPISLFVLHNRVNVEKRKTEIESQLKNAHIKSKSFEYLDKEHSIPLAFYSIFKKLRKFIEQHNLELKYETKTLRSSRNNPTISIPDSYTISDRLAIHTYTMKEGLKVKKLNVRHPDANKPKLILANKSGFHGAFIDDGRLGLVGGEKIYILGPDLNKLKPVFAFKIAYLIVNLTKYRMDILDTVAYYYIPDIRKCDMTESELYEKIGFSNAELDIINRYGRHYNGKRKYPTKKISQIRRKHIKTKKIKYF